MALQFQSSQVIDKPIDKVFHFFEVEHVRNHPRWDPDIELWLDSDAPIGVGTVIHRRNKPSGTSPTPLPTATPTDTLVYFWPATSTSIPVSTKTSNPPASTSAPTDTANPPTSSPTVTPTPTDTPLPQADLQITISDGVNVYLAGGTLTYTVVASNNGPANVTGIQIASAIPTQVLAWSWACAGQNNVANGCDPAAGSTSDFSDTVDLPSGGSIAYMVTVNIKGRVYGSLSTTGTIGSRGRGKTTRLTD